MRSFYSLIGVAGDSFSLPFTTSWAFGPLVLAVVRIVFSLYAFIAIFVTYGTQPWGIGRSFSFFTELTYWGLAFYTLVAGAHTLVYALRGRCWLDSWPRPLQALHTLFYTTIITFPFLVTIVYWAILYNGSWFPESLDQWRDVSKHGLNSLIALVELVFPDTPRPPVLHLAFIILLLALYLALAYVTHETQGYYPYAFLDPADGGGRLAGYILGILAAACVIFFIVWAIVWLRSKYTPAGKRSKYDVPRPTGRDIEMSYGSSRK
ncbi:uncharacterized protein HMPREF1541_02749 [Cyphellophora europaea CBS 101466]|uniref:FAR-17a/AIG1-like protein n=1 Tax=Cyphellophora europaea (strain CBS 101466) TaxID=1220924 RepID=W2S4R5_CYPE1|nr:uncharacterized protein HMPREF1541_02749 [Cyphellophora europaea CBS 101466]ETN43590.1 hypothetical protein HMPREF1541_02749 [Cyphellophora europaea CBS 101466]